MSVALVGRDTEHAALHDVLGLVADDGRSRVVLVSGEPGIGKTTLLDSLAEAELPRLTLLEGRAAEFERTLPFGLVRDALEPHLRRLDTVACVRLAAGLDAATVVLPELGERGPEPERYETHRAVRTLLERVAAGRTLALAFDDVHWADPASTELIAALLRRPPEAAVLLVLAYRAGQLPHGLAREITVAERDDRLTRIDLGPLPPEKAGELLGTSGAAAIYAEAGGNPFYLLQLARGSGAAAATGVEQGADAALAGVVPPAVASSLAAELGGLSTLAQAVAQAAAVAGEPFDHQLVMEIAGVPEEDALSGLDELGAVDLVRGAGVTFRFRHPLVRRGVYGSIAGGWRFAAHRRADRALAARGASPATRAHHVELASVAGDLVAADLLIDAADATRAATPELAIRWRRAAIERLPEIGAGSESRKLQLRLLAAALAHAGRLEESRATYELALASAPDHALVAELARVELLLGRAEDALARLDGALREAASQPRAVARLEARRSAVLRALARPGPMLAAAHRALDAARDVAEPALLAHAAAQLAVAQAVGDERGSVLATLAELDAAVRELDAGQLADAAEDLANAAWASWYAGAFAAALALGDRGQAGARLAGRVDIAFDVLCTRVLTLVALGRIAAAGEAAQAALENAQLLNSPGSLAGAHVMLSMAALPAGDIAGALDAGRDALGLAEEGGTPTHVAAAAWALGAALVETGRPREAIDLVVDRAGGAALPRYLPALRPAVHALLASAAIADGELDEAADWADRASASAASLGPGVDEVQGQRATAEVLVATRRDLDRAHGLLDAALLTCASTGAVTERLRVSYVLGAAHLATGDPGAAVTTWEALVVDATAAGAGLLLAVTIRALRGAGRRISVPRGTAGGVLSAREREIAELVGERLKNREIAARLFITEKTVETHLSRVFGKLGVRTRVDVARALKAEDAG